MKSISTSIAILLIATGVLGGCANNEPTQTSIPYQSTYQSHPARSGVIDSIDVIHTERNTSGAGVVVGGLVGGVLGNQVGGGNGRIATTVIGAVGGALVGNNVEQKRNAQAPDRYQIFVHFDDGNRESFMQDNIGEFRIGDRVRLVNGQLYRY